MTQTQHGHKPAGAADATPAGAIGAAAAAAATNGSSTPGAKASDKPADKVADDKPADDKTDVGAMAAKPKKEVINKLLVIVGSVHEFDTPAKAEKFLNGVDAPKEYSVYRGRRVGTNKKVSLR